MIRARFLQALLITTLLCVGTVIAAPSNPDRLPNWQNQLGRTKPEIKQIRKLELKELHTQAMYDVVGAGCGSRTPVGICRLPPFLEWLVWIGFPLEDQMWGYRMPFQMTEHNTAETASDHATKIQTQQWIQGRKQYIDSTGKPPSDLQVVAQHLTISKQENTGVLGTDSAIIKKAIQDAGKAKDMTAKRRAASTGAQALPDLGFTRMNANLLDTGFANYIRKKNSNTPGRNGPRPRLIPYNKSLFNFNEVPSDWMCHKWSPRAFDCDVKKHPAIKAIRTWLPGPTRSMTRFIHDTFNNKDLKEYSIDPSDKSRNGNWLMNCQRKDTETFPAVAELLVNQETIGDYKGKEKCLKELLGPVAPFYYVVKLVHPSKAAEVMSMRVLYLIRDLDLSRWGSDATAAGKGVRISKKKATYRHHVSKHSGGKRPVLGYTGKPLVPQPESAPRDALHPLTVGKRSDFTADSERYKPFCQNTRPPGLVGMGGSDDTEYVDGLPWDGGEHDEWIHENNGNHFKYGHWRHIRCCPCLYIPLIYFFPPHGWLQIQ